MEKVLIVEDSRVIALGLQKWIKYDLDFESDIAHSLREAEQLLQDNDTSYFISLLDLHLPDAPHGEIVDFMINRSIPSIVVSATHDDYTREAMKNKKIVDYVLKSHPKDMPQLLKLIRRIHNNRKTKVMIVDDSRQYRRYYSQLLENQRLTVFTAEDGQQALDTLDANPDIRLILTDYHMPRMNGYELVQHVREKCSQDKLAVIVFSTDESDDMASKFLKAGANDFINKTASIEEFLCRINMNLDILDMMHEIRDSANRDFLTKIFNRRYFFEKADVLYTLHKSADKPLIVAMVDIDFFKKVNDVYGHHAGDQVIKNLAKLLQQQCGEQGIVARFGGEEFCVLLTTTPATGVVDFFESIRLAAENTHVRVDNNDIRFTVSIGVTSSLGNSLADMINHADKLLYKAKQTSRNMVCFS